MCEVKGRGRKPIYNNDEERYNAKIRQTMESNIRKKQEKQEFRARITEQQYNIIKALSKNIILTPLQCSRIIRIMSENPAEIENVTKDFREFLTNMRNDLSDLVDMNDLEVYCDYLRGIQKEIQKRKEFL
jgi:hypothetical protein